MELAEELDVDVEVVGRTSRCFSGRRISSSSSDDVYMGDLRRDLDDALSLELPRLSV